MNLERLASFRAFSEHLNFTRAAADLHLTQPALHAQVKRLSQELGTTLYRREGRRLVLTPQGVEVAAFAREVGERCADFEGSLRGEADGPVILAAGEGSYLYLLGAALRAYLAAPPAPLTPLTLNAEGVVQALRSGEAHLGVAALDTAPAGLESETLTAMELALVMPEDHPLAARRTARLSDLRGLPLVVPPAGRPHRALLARHLAAAGVDWSVAVEAHGWPLMMRFVGLGVGLAVVNGCCRPPAGLVSRPIPALPGPRYLLMRRPARALPPGARALERLLIRHRNDWKDR